jgi:hypothetical protein
VSTGQIVGLVTLTVTGGLAGASDAWVSVGPWNATLVNPSNGQPIMGATAVRAAIIAPGEAGGVWTVTFAPSPGAGECHLPLLLLLLRLMHQTLWCRHQSTVTAKRCVAERHRSHRSVRATTVQCLVPGASNYLHHCAIGWRGRPDAV